MKAVINEKETPIRPNFPWIGQGENSKSLVVVFWDEQRATCLTSSGDYSFGEFYPAQMMDRFTPFTGSITLSND